MIWFFLASFRRKPESRFFTDLRIDWTPVFTGVTNEFQFFHSFRGARGDFCIQLICYHPIYRLHDRITFLQNFSTVKSQHFQTKRGYIGISNSVFLNMVAHPMLGSIHFHSQFCLGREEIHNMLTDWFLPIKLDAKKLFIPEA